MTGDCYVGSSIRLAIRFQSYYSIKYLESALKNGRSIICSALLKYGYSSFSLEILEYCEPGKCLEREQYYIDTLNPEYNIQKTAGSPLGHKHTDEARMKISLAKRGKFAGANNPNYGKVSATALAVYIYSASTNELISFYPSRVAAGEALGLSDNGVKYLIFKKRIHKGMILSHTKE